MTKAPAAAGAFQISARESGVAATDYFSFATTLSAKAAIIAA